jgi:hypothetical protein
MWESVISPLLAAAAPIDSAQGVEEVNVSKGGTLAGPGLVANGYDAVAFFTEGKPSFGLDTYAVAMEAGPTASRARRTSMHSRRTPGNWSRPMAASAPMAQRSPRSSTAIRAIGRSSTASST